MGSQRRQITVEVAYAATERQQVLQIRVPEGTTLIEAVKASGIVEQFPEIDLDTARLGIFGRVEHPERRLEAHDRVEIYRPLVTDPREARRRRARRGR